MLPTIDFDEAMKILERADSGKAADYRTVIAAAERLPLLWHSYWGNMRQCVVTAYKESAIADAIKVLSYQYLARKATSEADGE